MQLVDRGRSRRLDDVPRAAELAHAVVPAFQSFIAPGCAVLGRPVDFGDRVDRLQVRERDDGIHGGYLASVISHMH
jgi:hypothetical protein